MSYWLLKILFKHTINALVRKNLNPVNVTSTSFIKLKEKPNWLQKILKPATTINKYKENNLKRTNYNLRLHLNSK